MLIFENTPGEMIDVLIENNSFKPTLYTKVGEFVSQDIFDLLIEEKTGLKDYHSIKIVRIIEKFYNEKDSLPKEVKYHQVHISCLYDGFGSERLRIACPIFLGIEDLPQKVRQIKLEKILG